MTFILVVSVVGLLIAGIGYGLIWLFSKFFINRYSFEEEKLKEEEYQKNWRPIEIFCVKETRYFSIVRAEESYFLVDHCSPKGSSFNLFRRVDKRDAFLISQEEAQRLKDGIPFDFTMLGVGAVTTILAMFVTSHPVAVDYWLKDSMAILTFFFLGLLGVLAGIARVAKSRSNFKKKEKRIFQRAKPVRIKIKSKQKYLLFIVFIWLVQLYWLPISLDTKVFFVSISFEEIVVRVYSSIGKLRKRKFDDDVSWIDKKLYGQEAYYTDVSNASEIWHDYPRK